MTFKCYMAIKREERERAGGEENRKQLDKNIFLIVEWRSTSNCKKL